MLKAIEVAAADAESARNQGAAQFGVPPQDVLAVNVGPGRYRAQLANSDAALEIELSPDKMRATVKEYLPHAGSGKALTQPMIRAALKAAGVKVEPDPALLAGLLAAIAKGEDPKGLLVAEGKPARPAEERHFELLGDVRFPVFPGDVFANDLPARPATVGSTLEGLPIKPGPSPKASSPKAVVVKSGARLDPNRVSIRAEIYGMVKLDREKGTIEVKPLLPVSADLIEVIGPFFGVDYFGHDVGWDRIQGLIAKGGFRAEPNRAAVEAALQEARESGLPVQTTLLKGLAPIPGEDGRLELEVPVGASAGEIRDDGSIDFKERHLVRTVHRGDLLGRLRPPTKGVPGKDVYGRIIPARDGMPANLIVGPGVQRSPNGLELKASAEGVVVFVHNTLSVTQILEIPGDVNYSTGNIRADKGSVNIHGGVETGFSVCSAGSIVIGDVVAGAQIEATGDIEVLRGLSMLGKGRVVAGGTIRCHFAENAQLVASGDVIVDNSITNCDITAQSKVIATRGRGRIQGGTIRARRGIEANQIGSELGARTLVVIEQDSPALATLQAERGKLEQGLKKIAFAIGEGDRETLLARAPASRKRQVEEQLAARAGLEKQMERIDADLKAERKRLAEAPIGAVVVRRVVYPGTTVVIAGCSFEVVREMRATRFFRDPSGERIELGTA